MESITIKNLRSLTDTGAIEIKPITLLLGENSSGKSTFLRLFPLLRQSTEVITRGPVLWYGSFVDFGSFKEAINKYNNNNEISFGFQFNFSSIRNRFIEESYNIGDNKMFIEIIVTSDQQERTKIKSIKLKIFTHNITINADENRLNNLIINGFEFYDSNRSKAILYQGNRVVPRIIETFDRQGTYPSNLREFAVIGNSLLSEIRRHVTTQTSDKTTKKIARSINIASSEDILTQIGSIGTKSWKKKVKGWTIDNKDFQNIQNLVILRDINDILTMCNDYIVNFSSNSYYIAPLRATAERYYRFQDLAVDDIDFQGRNLAMFLHSLSIYQKRDFSHWVQQHFGFYPEVRSEFGHILLRIKDPKSDIEFNLADMGFGFSQVLPILTQLWSITYQHIKTKHHKNKKTITFAIEQPELHLHPRLQSKLAEVFVNTIDSAKNIGLDLRLIIETHSEYIINRFGHLISKNKFHSNDINIVLFEKKDIYGTNVIISHYDDQGFLSNWPMGFFDVD